LVVLVSITEHYPNWIKFAEKKGLSPTMLDNIPLGAVLSISAAGLDMLTSIVSDHLTMCLEVALKSDQEVSTVRRNFLKRMTLVFFSLNLIALMAFVNPHNDHICATKHKATSTENMCLTKLEGITRTSFLMQLAMILFNLALYDISLWKPLWDNCCSLYCGESPKCMFARPRREGPKKYHMYADLGVPSTDWKLRAALDKQDRCKPYNSAEKSKDVNQAFIVVFYVYMFGGTNYPSVVVLGAILFTFLKLRVSSWKLVLVYRRPYPDRTNFIEDLGQFLELCFWFVIGVNAILLLAFNRVSSSAQTVPNSTSGDFASPDLHEGHIVSVLCLRLGLNNEQGQFLGVFFAFGFFKILLDIFLDDVDPITKKARLHQAWHRDEIRQARMQRMEHASTPCEEGFHV